MFAVLGLAGGYLLVRKQLLRLGRSDDENATFLIFVFVGVFLGARLGHILFYDPGFYLSHPFEMLRMWGGGLSSHGGAVGLLIAVAVYLRKHPDLTFIRLGDHIAAGVAFMAASIRAGNFFNSEILGKPSDLPWAVIFSRFDNIPRHPATVYELLSYLVLSAVLLFASGKPWGARYGLRTGLLIVWVFSFRVLIEFVKEGQSSIDPHLPLNVGQLLSLPFLAFGLFLFIRSLLSSGTVQPPVLKKTARERKR
jgi:prolipoprotein diacylglyceryl transferase